MKGKAGSWENKADWGLNKKKMGTRPKSFKSSPSLARPGIADCVVGAAQATPSSHVFLRIRRTFNAKPPGLPNLLISYVEAVDFG